MTNNKGSSTSAVGAKFLSPARKRWVQMQNSSEPCKGDIKSPRDQRKTKRSEKAAGPSAPAAFFCAQETYFETVAGLVHTG